MESNAKVREMCKNIGVAEGRTSDEYLFTIQCADLFYYRGNIGQVDIKTGFVDGVRDGGIDFIYGDSETMYLIQGKSTDSLSLDDIKNVFRKMVETVVNFSDRKYDEYSGKLKAAFLNAYDKLNDDKNIELVLFTNTIMTEEFRRKIAEFCEEDQMSSYSVSVYDKNDIERKSIEENELVPEDYILIDISNKNHSLTYGDNGLIVNAKASSIKRLYDKWGQNGLFSFNIREHIAQKNVDDAIDKTINEEKDNFWYYNNGITIGCGDFHPDGYKIKLYKFSIINGAQTTTKIGKSRSISDSYDFDVVCKIVKANIGGKSTDFIGKISEASNSQKPIRPRDLKSNAIEQKKLQEGCANNGNHSLAVEIKRGVKAPNHKQIREKEYRVTNEFIGQLIYACLLQKPGSARSDKNSMFSSKSVYKSIYLRKHDFDTIFDLVRIASVYDEYSDECIKSAKHKDDMEWISAVQNGKLVVMAVTIYLLKKKRGLVENCTGDQLHKDNISGLLISNYPKDDLNKKIYDLFDYIIRKLINIYNVKQESMKITSYSNFFKTDNNYEVILREFDNLDDWDKEKVDSYMEVFPA